MVYGIKMNEYTLRQLIRIHNGKDYTKLGSGDIPVFGTGGIITKVNQYLFDGEAIFLPRKGSLENIGFYVGKFWTIDTMYYASIIDTSISDAYYLYRYIDLLDLSFLDSGSTLPSMTNDSYYDIKVKLPDIETQKRISLMLRNIDSKIISLSEIIDRNRQITRLIYDYWFVQFDFPNELGRPYKTCGGMMVWNDMLKREIPFGWTDSTFSALVESVNTGLNPRKNFSLGQGSNFYVTIKNIEHGNVNFTKCDYIDDNALRIIQNRSNLATGDILFTSISPVGRLFLIMEEPKNWNINESLFSIKYKKNSTNPFYLYSVLESNETKMRMDNLMVGSIMDGIRIETLLNFPVLFPLKKTMDDYMRFAQLAFDMIHMNQSEIQNLDKLRCLLTPLLLDGHVYLLDSPK
jgi:type I restriction enzyme S subunit